MTELVTSAQQAVDEDLHELAFDLEAVKQAMLENLDFLAPLVLPEICTAKFAPIHHNIWQKLTEAVAGTERLLRYAIGIPRGHAKTQIIKLLCIYAILFTKRQFILVVCNTATLAQNLVNDVCDMLDEPNVIEVFGDWKENIETDNNEMKKFKFCGRDIIIKPMGSGSSVRGLNIKNRRPDIMICDDMQSREEAMSPEVAKANKSWFLGTLLKAKSPKCCTVIYIGNMYPDVEIGERGSGIYGCLLRNLQLNSEWLSWIVGAIQEDGTALWEAVHPLEALLSELRQDIAMDEEATFMAEVMNDPKANTSKWIAPEKIAPPPYTTYDLVIGRFLIIDPSLGKKKSDDQIVNLYEVYDDRGPVLKEIRNIKDSAPNLVREVLQWSLVGRIPLVCSEAVAYQGTLLQWFAHYIELLCIEGIALAPVTPKGASKASRILASFKSLASGSIMLSNECRAEYLAQALLYDPSKSNNVDDILDNVAYSEEAFVTLSSEYLLPYEFGEPTDPTTQAVSESTTLLEHLEV